MKEKQTPGQIINVGICVISATLGGIAGIIWNAPSNGKLIGLVVGLVVGLILCTIRPKHGKTHGLWKHINHFMLTQMDWSSAFSRDKKESQHHPAPYPEQRKSAVQER